MRSAAATLVADRKPVPVDPFAAGHDARVQQGRLTSLCRSHRMIVALDDVVSHVMLQAATDLMSGFFRCCLRTADCGESGMRNRFDLWRACTFLIRRRIRCHRRLQGLLRRWLTRRRDEIAGCIARWKALEEEAAGKLPFAAFVASWVPDDDKRVVVVEYRRQCCHRHMDEVTEYLKAQVRRSANFFDIAASLRSVLPVGYRVVKGFVFHLLSNIQCDPVFGFHRCTVLALVLQAAQLDRARRPPLPSFADPPASVVTTDFASTAAPTKPVSPAASPARRARGSAAASGGVTRAEMDGLLTSWVRGRLQHGCGAGCDLPTDPFVECEPLQAYTSSHVFPNHPLSRTRPRKAISLFQAGLVFQPTVRRERLSREVRAMLERAPARRPSRVELLHATALAAQAAARGAAEAEKIAARTSEGEPGSSPGAKVALSEPLAVSAPLAETCDGTADSQSNTRPPTPNVEDAARAEAWNAHVRALKRENATTFFGEDWVEQGEWDGDITATDVPTAAQRGAAVPSSAATVTEIQAGDKHRIRMALLRSTPPRGCRSPFTGLNGNFESNFYFEEKFVPDSQRRANTFFVVPPAAVGQGTVRPSRHSQQHQGAASPHHSDRATIAAGQRGDRMRGDERLAAVCDAWDVLSLTPHAPAPLSGRKSTSSPLPKESRDKQRSSAEPATDSDANGASCCMFAARLLARRTADSPTDVFAGRRVRSFESLARNVASEESSEASPLPPTVFAVRSAPLLRRVVRPSRSQGVYYGTEPDDPFPTLRRAGYIGPEAARQDRVRAQAEAALLLQDRRLIGRAVREAADDVAPQVTTDSGMHAAERIGATHDPRPPLTGRPSKRAEKPPRPSSLVTWSAAVPTSVRDDGSANAKEKDGEGGTRSHRRAGVSLVKESKPIAQRRFLVLSPQRIREVASSARRQSPRLRESVPHRATSPVGAGSCAMRAAPSPSSLLEAPPIMRSRRV